MAAFTGFSTPDDGCCDTRNMYSDFAINKYLYTVASGWSLLTLNYNERNHELQNNVIHLLCYIMTYKFIEFFSARQNEYLRREKTGEN